jgi:lipopolysaccharide export system permease protein
LSEGRFLHPSEGVTFYIGEITPEGELRNVFLSDARVPERRVTYTASSALLARSDTGPRLLMFDGMAQTYLPKERRLATTRFSDFAFNIASVIDTPTSGRRQLSEVPTPVLLNPSPEFLAENRFSYPAALREAHGRFNQALQCIVAPLMGFAFLLVGGYSRFGVWWQILAAIAAMALLQSMGSAMANIARHDAGLWPLHYAPQGVGLALILVLLWWAAHPHAFRRRRGGAIS